MRLDDVVGIARNYLFGGAIIAVLCILVVGAGYFLIYKKLMRGQRRLRPGKLMLGIITFLNLFVVLGAVLLNRHQGLVDIQLQPFHSYQQAWHQWSVKEWRNIILNILMFVPLGILLPLWSTRLRRFWRVGLCGFGFSLLIELAQFITSRGVLETDDLIGNTLGALIGYGFGMLAINLAGRTRVSAARWLGYLAPTLVTAAAFGGIFVAYGLQELGNLQSNAYTRVDMKQVALSSEVELDGQPGSAPIYTTLVGNERETREVAQTLFEQVGSTLDESRNDIYYETAVYRDEDRRSVWVTFRGMTYRYTDFSQFDEDVMPVLDAEETSLRTALAAMGIEVPEEAAFQPMDGGYLFTADLIEVGDEIWHGRIHADYYSDGTVKSITNDIVVFEPYRAAEIISEAEAYERLAAGRFAIWQRAIDQLTVTGVRLDYELDSKGFFQPVYRFDVVIENRDELSVVIAALR